MRMRLLIPVCLSGCLIGWDPPHSPDGGPDDSGDSGIAGDICGDDEAGERDCDGDDLDGATCAALGFHDGELGCIDCEFDTTACHNCGDGELQEAEGEACDWGDSENSGVYGGCNADCTLAPYCGDGVRDALEGEECDDGAVNNTGVAGGCDANCNHVPDACEISLGVDCDTFEQGYLKASNTGADDEFGHALALYEDTLVVGVPYEDGPGRGIDPTDSGDGAEDSGAVYVFRRHGSAWQQEAYIKASNADAGDEFGFAVAIDVDTLVVGAPQESGAGRGDAADETDNTAGASGAAYVFNRDGGTWTQTAYLKASNADAGDLFGTSIDVYESRLVVGSPGEDSSALLAGGDPLDNSQADSGAVYAFDISNGSWLEQAYLKASNTRSYNDFGQTVTLHGDTLAVGAPGDDSQATGVDGNSGDIAAGESGAVHIYRSEAGSWGHEAYLKPSNTQDADRFGTALSLYGDTLAVGVPREDSSATGIDGNDADNTAMSSGAVFIFTRNAGSWSQQAYLKPSNTEANDAFGASVSLYRRQLAVGAWGEDGGSRGLNGSPLDNSATASGAVYLFEDRGSGWEQTAYVKTSNAESPDQAGRAVAMYGGTLALGAGDESSAALGVDGDQADNSANSAGAVYIRVVAPDPCMAAFGIECSEFETAYLKASNTDAGDEFGYAVSLSGDLLAVGAHRESSRATGIDGNQADDSASRSGAVYLYRRAAGVWAQEAYVKAPNAEAGDQFGYSVAVADDTLVVGAPGEASLASGIDGDQADNSAVGAGAVYVFRRGTSSWASEAYLKASNPNGGDGFGNAVALDGDVLVVGAGSEDSSAVGVNGGESDNGARGSGAAYVFRRTGTAWTQEAYLKASNTEAADDFGADVLAVDGDTIAVGAHAEDGGSCGAGGDPSDNSALQAGAVFIFHRANGAWAQQAFLKAENCEAGDEFGWALALDGDRLAVGAGGESSSTGADPADNGAWSSGAVYVFERANAQWTQTAYLKATVPRPGDYFGFQLALDGDHLAVGAGGHEGAKPGVNHDEWSLGAPGSGAVHVFRHDGSDWRQVAHVKPLFPRGDAYFGNALDLEGSTMAVGALGEPSSASDIDGDQSDDSSPNAGAVYIRTIPR